MRQILRATLLLLVCLTASWAGALYLEIGKPEAFLEAKMMKALVVARATACHEPAQSVVSASVIEATDKQLRRTALQVVPLKTPGVFAVIGNAPIGSVIDLAVTNPEYQNYEPRVLIRQGPQGVELASAKHFFSKPPNEGDLREMFEATR
jgi:hypothetical protein